jgi:hypothetical protein
MWFARVNGPVIKIANIFSCVSATSAGVKAKQPVDIVVYLRVVRRRYCTRLYPHGKKQVNFLHKLYCHAGSFSLPILSRSRDTGRWGVTLQLFPHGNWSLVYLQQVIDPMAFLGPPCHLFVPSIIGYLVTDRRSRWRTTSSCCGHCHGAHSCTVRMF